MNYVERAEKMAQYDFVDRFCEGLAPARKNGEWFHVRLSDGEPAYEERFDAVGAFQNGVATVMKDGVKIKIDTTGAKVLDSPT